MFGTVRSHHPFAARILRLLTPAIYFLACHPKTDKVAVWQAPDTAAIPATEQGRLIRYGRALVAHTSLYLGPKGSVARISNGMNCQNCHLDAGTRPWGNNYSAVFSTYPKFRDRSGSIETIARRVNDCIERSLNGSPLDTNSTEMKALAAYFQWLGRNVPKGVRPSGAGISELAYLSRAADPVRGHAVFVRNCQRCHGPEGGGAWNADSSAYLYPPLWGDHSYNTGAGLYRISRLAGYVKDNMPLGCSHDSTALTDEEAWDVAAFISSQPRPAKSFRGDWPDLFKKPFDHPFGPYTDSFSDRQHKYGPFGPITHRH
ncbi:MAG TPA: c-type cytochrome [Puia sp.]|nr:c-type cytochrome [Puia sp.]